MKTILIIDDEIRFQSLFQRVLTDEGFEITSSDNAMDGYEQLKKRHFDLILLDIRMPGIDGPSIYDVIKMFLRDIKVIVTSVIPEAEQRRLIPDAYDYFDKSTGVTTLIKKVKEVLHEEPV